jgi:cellulose synthase/poly-beta-1,6-N-acetylglucosamine synthase-like glycosyltransferase
MNPLLEQTSYFLALFLGMLATATGAYSTILGRRYDRQVWNSISRPKNDYHPRACVIMPCKGDESGLVSNIEAILNLDYPNYSVTMVKHQS